MMRVKGLMRMMGVERNWRKRRCKDACRTRMLKPKKFDF